MPSIASVISRVCLPVAAITVLVLSSCGGDEKDAGDPSPESTSATTALAAEAPVRLYAADAEDQAGAITAGDFNGDGVADVALAAAFADGLQNGQVDSGEVYLFLGPLRPGEVRDAATGGQALTIYGPAAGAQAGRALASGDFNGDGIDDIMIGSPFADGPAANRPDAGRVDVVYGNANLGSSPEMELQASGDFTVHGASAGDLAGISLATGQVNGDQADDLLVGAFWAAGPDDARLMAGEAYLIFGSADSGQTQDLSVSPADVTVYGALSEDRLGEGVAVGDVSGDGLNDLILPAPFATNPEGQQDAGRTYVVISPPPATVDLASYHPAATIHGVDDGDQLGHVPVTGDIDGDDREDVILTAVSADGPNNTVDLAGEAVVVMAPNLSGDVRGTPGDADYVIYGDRSEDRLGRSAWAGDVDGDGTDELLLGSPGSTSDSGQAFAGRIYVLYEDELSAEVVLPSHASIFDGEHAGDSLSSEVFGRLPINAADMDGDGDDEVLVVAPQGDGPEDSRTDCGEALVLFISEDGPR